MIWRQTELSIAAKPRGFHIITGEVVRAIDLSGIHIGMLQLFIKHTSASLTLNENASADVRADFERYFNARVPDDTAYFEHIYEGADDMPAHIKASLLGNSLSIPITNEALNLGTWQGIYLGEHRNRATARSLVASVWGSTGKSA